MSRLATSTRLPAGRHRAPRAHRIVLAILGLQFLVVAGIQAWRDSPTADEPYYIASGVTALTRHDLRINIEHPPLAKVLAALPVLAAHPVVPEGEGWRSGNEYLYVPDFMAAQGSRQHLVVFLSRLVPLVEALAVGIVLYLLGRELFGRDAGLLSAGVWLTLPVTVGFGHVNGLDVPSALAVLVAALLLAKHLRAPRTGLLVGLGVAVGAACLVRGSNLVLAVAVVLGLAAGAARRPATVAAESVLVLVVAFAAVWLGVRAVAAAVPPDGALAFTVTHVREEPGSWSATLARLPPWPREYDLGLGYLAAESAKPAPAFLLGHAWTGGRWWYWPLITVVKIPFTVLVLTATGIVALWSAWPESRRRAVAVLVPPAVLLMVPVLTTDRPFGVRYLLPVLVVMIAAAGPAAAMLRRGRWPRALVGVSLATLPAFLYSSLPHSLAWTAPPFPAAYRVTTDSNVDWGQDYDALLTWSRGKQPWVAYFGPRGVTGQSIAGARPLLTARVSQIDGWVAVSASNLTAYERDRLSWLRAYCPTATLGGSILLYRFAVPPTPDPGPVTPAPVCLGQPSHRTR